MDNEFRNVPIGAGGAALREAGSALFRAPGSGMPASPNDAGARPNSLDIADAISRRLTVPKGPIRTNTLMLGVQGGTQNSPFSFNAAALNSTIIRPLMAGPGRIRSLDVLGQFVTTGAAAGILQFFDSDINAPLVRAFPFNFGAAGTFNVIYSIAAVDIPFLVGLTAVWNVITGAFGSSMLFANIDFESIPIGQAMALSNV